MALEIEQDLRFQHREWALQRVGWVGMAVVVLAALAGLLGPGPLGEATSRSGDRTVAVAYPRFVRAGAVHRITVTVAGSVAGRDDAEILLSRDYLSEVEIEAIAPEPDRHELAGTDIRYVFAAGADVEDLRVQFLLRPDGVGPVAGRLSAGGSESVTFRQFVHP